MQIFSLELIYFKFLKFSAEEIVREMMKSDLKKSEPAVGGPSAQV